MAFTKEELWLRFNQYYWEYPELGLAIDISRMGFTGEWLKTMQPLVTRAFEEMDSLEAGAIANKDEQRMVGHYWLRNPSLAPTPEIRQAIETTVAGIKAFTGKVHRGEIKATKGSFTHLLLIGIGGSALGPEFVSKALGVPRKDKLAINFLDNTDPDGMDKILSSIKPHFATCLVIVISKSGGTKETRNGMLEAKAAFERANVDFAAQAVAVTGEGSDLDKYAIQNGWLARFPMWDWVGGRTSELSGVGLLPAALQGFDIDAILEGAKACDAITRARDWKRNPAAQLALMWHYAGGGKGAKNLVMLPYKDSLELFSKYLQQLLMESLGKSLDRDGKPVNQGLTVLGNKGSTDQHSYIQQLREGLPNFFVTFIEVLKDREGHSIFVESEVTTGDYLEGFFLGTRQALYENGRESITLTVKALTPFAIGVLIALFERAVGLYASYINVNAYHQPGVEAGKKAATAIITTQIKVNEFLTAHKGKYFGIEAISEAINAPQETEHVFKICEHLSANMDRNIQRLPGKIPSEAQYRSR
jgi:glucose-6-phosphate isomerase